MTPRRATTTKITPEQRERIARATTVVSEKQHTCALPPPAAWPVEVKRHAAARLGRVTFEDYARPFGPGSDEPMWLLLRAAANHIRRDYRHVTKEEAWIVCSTAARSLAASTTEAAA